MALSTALLFVGIICLALGVVLNGVAKAKGYNDKSKLLSLLKFCIRFSNTTAPHFGNQSPITPVIKERGVFEQLKEEGALPEEPCIAYLGSENIFAVGNKKKKCGFTCYDEVVQEMYLTPSMLYAGSKVAQFPCCCHPANCFSGCRKKDYIFTFVSLASPELMGMEMHGTVNKFPRTQKGCCCCKCITDPSNGSRQVDIAFAGDFPITNQAFADRSGAAGELDEELGQMEKADMIQFRKAFAAMMCSKQETAAHIQAMMASGSEGKSGLLGGAKNMVLGRV